MERWLRWVKIYAVELNRLEEQVMMKSRGKNQPPGWLAECRPVVVDYPTHRLRPAKQDNWLPEKRDHS